MRRPVESEQYTSIDYTQTLADHGVLASVGSVGDAYDNAVAESFVDSFKTELIADRVWRSRSQLELAVVEYIGWFNHDRLHEALGDIPPAEMEALYAHRTETNISLKKKRSSQLTRISVKAGPAQRSDRDTSATTQRCSLAPTHSPKTRHHTNR